MKDLYRKWHEHPGHYPFHWGVLIFTSIFITSLLIGQIDKTYSEYPEIQRVTAATGGEHNYFNSLISRPEHHQSWSLRDQAQLDSLNPSSYTSDMFKYNPAFDSYYDAQDAAKFYRPIDTPNEDGYYSASIPGHQQLIMQISPKVDSGSMLMTWDWYWGKEFRENRDWVNYWKSFQFVMGGHGWWTMMSELVKASKTDTSEVAKVSDSFRSGALPIEDARREPWAYPGVGTPEQQTFPLYHGRWTRYWVEIKMFQPPSAFTDFSRAYLNNELVRANPDDPQGRWHMVSLWIADENRSAQRLLYKVPINWNGGLGWDPRISEFKLEMNTSQRGTVPAGPLIAYTRNVVLLRDYNLPEVPETDSFIFQKPIRNSNPLPPPVLDTTAPTVSLTAPSNNATVSGNVSVTATASDNVGVSGVQFKLDGVNIGSEDNSSPYSFTWNTTGTANGAKVLTAVARDAAGNTRTSSAVNVTVSNTTAPVGDTTAPVVSITAPAARAILSGTTNVTADASDNIGVVGVQFKLDGVNLGSEDTVSPYSLSWNTSQSTNGSKDLTAVARDQAGNTTTSSAVNVTVSNNVVTPPPPSDTTAPSAPSNLTATAVSPTQVNLSWSASTDNVAVTGYRLESCAGTSCTNFTQIESLTGIAYSNLSLNSAAIYRYRVRAVDAAGNFSNYSSIATATTQAAPDTTLPTVSLTSPANGAEVSGNVNITATASDNVGVSGVQFKLDGINLGAEDTTPPYSISWDTTESTNGSKSLIAIARDAAGNTKASTAVSVTVSNEVTTPTDTTNPSRPTNLSANPVSSSQINLSWSASTDNVEVAGYRVFRNGIQIATAITTTTYQDKGRSASTSYTYTVLAYDAAGNTSSQSNSISATTEARASSPVVIKPTPTPTPTTPVVTNPTTPTVPVSYNPPLPPTQTTSLPSRLQNIFKPTVEENAPADNSTDVSAPLIQKFAIENTDSPKTVKVTFDASDTGGANLWRAYLFRAEYEEEICDETDKSGCVWTAVENSTAPEGSEQWSTTLEHKLTPGTHWYSFQVIDRAGNRGFEQEPIKIIKPEGILKDLFLRILRLVGWNR